MKPKVLKEILRCPEVRNNNRHCSRYSILADKLPPLIQKYSNSQKIMLISQAPSKNAHSNNVLNTVENDFFERMINIIGISAEEFQNKIYWTHYCKCYPGPAKGGDRKPNKFCADKFLKDEITEINPRCIIAMGRLPVKWLLNDSLKNSIEKALNGIRYYDIEERKIKVIPTLHFSSSASGHRTKYRFSETLILIKECLNRHV